MDIHKQNSKLRSRKTKTAFCTYALILTLCILSPLNQTFANPTPAVTDGSTATTTSTASPDGIITALRDFVQRMGVIGMHQVKVIGTFFDAKQQLENQRDMQALKAAAVKDYHPSDQMCRIGSYIRSVAATDEKASYDHIGLNDVFMDSVTNYRNGISQLGAEGYSAYRLNQFKTTYCDPNDHKGVIQLLCTNADGSIGAADPKRRNNDINYQRTVGFTSTLDVDLTDTAQTEAEEDIIAMARNLYWPEAFKDFDSYDALEAKEEIQRARKLIAMTNLAHNTFAKQISMKAASPPASTDPADPKPGWTYMKTMMREFGLSDDDINAMVGENPSYNAQMEILTKKMTQSPDFYTNLYDKPTNVDRIQASLQAISIMQQRDMHEAMMRKEMLLSGIVETELIRDAEIIEGTILNLQ